MMRMWSVSGAGALVILAIVAGELGAQVTIGAKAGLNAASISWTPGPLGNGPEELTRRRAFTGGLMLTAEMPGPLRFRAELLHTGKGFTDTDSNGDVTRLLLDYIEVPLLVGFIAPEASRWRPEVYGGPWMSWETRCDGELDSMSTSLSFDCDEIPGDPLLRKTTDFGVTVGASLTFVGVGRLHGLVDLRYTAGLRNVDDAPEIDNIRAKHRGYGLSVGLLVPLGR